MTTRQPTQLSPLARFEKILVATDASPFSADAVQIAIAMSAKAGAHLYLFTMVLTNPEYETLAPLLVQKASEDANAHLAAIVVAAERESVHATPLIRSGDSPHREIIAAAEELNADLIVMGQQGRRGLARMMVGDATSRVIGAASCSVLSVPVGASMWRKRILVCTDGSRFGDAAAVSAAKIAHCCVAPVTVVSALVPSHSERRQQEGREAVERTTAQLLLEGLEVDGVALPGEADDVIIALAEKIGADLIVVGTHGRTGFGKVLLGSVAERVIGKAKCAVLVVKAY
jgi:nucleotide-binding universal stress UspA family protein